MHSNDLKAFQFTLRLSMITLVVATAFVAGAPPTPSRAAPPGVQYDQLVKFVTSNQAPQPGTFETDWQTSMNAIQQANNQPQHHGLFGGVMNVVTQAQNAVSMIQNGIPSTEYYWNGWERTDDPATQTATITKPLQHQVIHLDLKNKTYRVEDTTVHPMAETPPPYQRPPGPSGTLPPQQPGTAKVTVTASATSLGSKVVGGQQSDGYKLDFKITSTHATGSCTNGSFETGMIIWNSRLPEPKVAAAPGATVKRGSAAPNPELGSFKPGCTPTVTARTHLGPTPPGDRLAMWELVALNLGMQTSQGSGQGGFTTMIERGNVRQLGPDAASLFEIPAGFTLAPSSPAP